MGTGRQYQVKHRCRPVKSRIERDRRHKVQRRRLVSLGMAPEAVEKLQPDAVRALLRHPARVALVASVD